MNLWPAFLGVFFGGCVGEPLKMAVLLVSLQNHLKRGTFKAHPYLSSPSDEPKPLGHNV